MFDVSDLARTHFNGSRKERNNISTMSISCLAILSVEAPPSQGRLVGNLPEITAVWAVAVQYLHRRFEAAKYDRIQGHEKLSAVESKTDA